MAMKATQLEDEPPKPRPLRSKKWEQFIKTPTPISEGVKGSEDSDELIPKGFTGHTGILIKPKTNVTSIGRLPRKPRNSFDSDEEYEAYEVLRLAQANRGERIANALEKAGWVEESEQGSIDPSVREEPTAEVIPLTGATAEPEDEVRRLNAWLAHHQPTGLLRSIPTEPSDMRCETDQRVIHKRLDTIDEYEVEYTLRYYPVAVREHGGARREREWREVRKTETRLHWNYYKPDGMFWILSGERDPETGKYKQDAYFASLKTRRSQNKRMKLNRPVKTANMTKGPWVDEYFANAEGWRFIPDVAWFVKNPSGMFHGATRPYPDGITTGIEGINQPHDQRVKHRLAEIENFNERCKLQVDIARNRILNPRANEPEEIRALVLSLMYQCGDRDYEIMVDRTKGNYDPTDLPWDELETSKTEYFEVSESSNDDSYESEEPINTTHSQDWIDAEYEVIGEEEITDRMGMTADNLRRLIIKTVDPNFAWKPLPLLPRARLAREEQIGTRLKHISNDGFAWTWPHRSNIEEWERDVEEPTVPDPVEAWENEGGSIMQPQSQIDQEGEPVEAMQTLEYETPHGHTEVMRFNLADPRTPGIIKALWDRCLMDVDDLLEFAERLDEIKFSAQHFQRHGVLPPEPVVEAAMEATNQFDWSQVDISVERVPNKHKYRKLTKHRAEQMQDYARREPHGWAPSYDYVAWWVKTLNRKEKEQELKLNQQLSHINTQNQIRAKVESERLKKLATNRKRHLVVHKLLGITPMVEQERKVTRGFDRAMRQLAKAQRRERIGIWLEKKFYHDWQARINKPISLVNKVKKAVRRAKLNAGLGTKTKWSEQQTTTIGQWALNELKTTFPGYSSIRSKEIKSIPPTVDTEPSSESSVVPLPQREPRDVPVLKVPEQEEQSQIIVPEVKEIYLDDLTQARMKAFRAEMEKQGVVFSQEDEKIFHTRVGQRAQQHREHRAMLIA